MLVGLFRWIHFASVGPWSSFELSYMYICSSIECVFISFLDVIQKVCKYDAYLRYTCIILTIFFPLF